jgi:hypothetical protein
MSVTTALNEAPSDLQLAMPSLAMPNPPVEAVQGSPTLGRSQVNPTLDCPRGGIPEIPPAYLISGEKAPDDLTRSDRPAAAVVNRRSCGSHLDVDTGCR